MFKEIILFAALLVAVALAMHPLEENQHRQLSPHSIGNGHHLKTVKHHSHGQEHIQHGKRAVPVPAIVSHGQKQNNKATSHKKPGTRLVQGHKKHRHLQHQNNHRSKSRNKSHEGKHHQKRHSGARRHF